MAQLLRNTVAIVTGGASGLGKACVDRLAAQGVRVTSVDFSYKERSRDAKTSVETFPADISSDSDITSLMNHVGNTHGRLDFLINCAGLCLPGPVYDFTTNAPFNLTEFTKMLQVNTIGTFNMARLGIGLMSRNAPGPEGGRGVIINVASSLGFESGMGMVAYGASKAAVIGMTLGLAREFSSVGVRVVTISPGMFRTPMLHERYASECAKMSLFPGRPGNPDEFAHLVQAIIENPIINGEVIRLDSGSRYPQFS